MPFDVSFAVPDWEEKLRAGKAPLPTLPVDEARRERAVRLLDRMRLPDVDGQPTIGQAGADWIREVTGLTFAARHPETALPLVSELFLLVPKKNSKTTYAGALGLVWLLLNETANVEGMILGPTQTVAERCFHQMAGMIKADPVLVKLFKVQEHLKKITRISTDASISVRTFDMNVVTGGILAFLVLDELHVIAAKSYAKRVLAQLKGGMITNAEALMITITTQSDVEPMGVFREELERARAIRDGRITEGVRTLAVLYEFPEAIQTDPAQPWTDPELWPMVLPNLGRSIKLNLLRDLFEQERNHGPRALALWASQHLNIQIGLGMHDGRWVAADHWAQNADPALTLSELIATSDVAVVGGDAGGADDLFGLFVIGRHKETRRWQGWARAWCLDIVLERRKDIAVKLQDLDAQGEIEITQTAQAQIEAFADIVDQLAAAELLPAKGAIGLDPAGIAALVDELELRGYTFGEQIVGVSQGWRLNGAILGIERRLLDGSFRHGGQSLMTWCMGNARAEKRGNNTMITKAAAGSAKIDPVIAMFNAAQLMDRNPVASRKRAVSIPADYEV